MIYLVSGGNLVLMPNGWIWASVSVSLAVSLTFYVLRSIGIYKLAKNNGYAHAFLGWIPFAWIYLAGKMCGNVTFFGKKFGGFVVLLVTMFSVTQALNLVYYFLTYYPIAGYFLQGGTIYYVSSSSDVQGWVEYPLRYNIYTETDITVNYLYSQAFIKFFNALVIISNILDLVMIVLSVTFYFALFGKFWPAHSFIASILSVFGLFGVFAFVIRNKKPMTREEFLRMRYGYYQNPYGGAPNNGAGAPKPPETPFPEFADRGEIDPGDPFGEFSDSKTKEKDDDPFGEFSDKSNGGDGKGEN